MADNRERARALADRIGIIPDDDFANAEILAEIDAAFSRGSASIADEATVETRGSAWRPIESAPREGSILVWGPHGHEWLVVEWDDSKGNRFPWSTMDGPYYPAGAFTHWQPLPDPPAALAAIPAPPAPLKERNT